MGENVEMELANLWFRSQSPSLSGQLEQARTLGFRGLGLLNPAPSLSQTPLKTPDHVSVISLAALRELDDAIPSWKQISIADTLKALKVHSCSQLLVPAGLDLRVEVRSRADKLLARVHAGETIDPEEEALEEILVQAELESERQLERFAAYLHDLRKRAPGLKVAIAPEASAASLLNPARLRLLLEEIKDLDIGFWHDSGQLEMRHAGGLEHPGEWLDGFANLLHGSTLHDFSGGAEHLPPGIGKVDWSLVADYLPRQSLRILAVAPSYPSEVLAEARTTLESRLPS
ncbi:MAG: hypothetical protein COA70_12045 [Planctomycetota bacterium]|nr:MAG: hypothetical protein COA70_12045 [Planctomycetota bacterium]